MYDISLFTGKLDNQPKPKSFETFEALTEALKEPRVSEDKDGPLWSPAKFSGKRAKGNVQSVCCLVLDFDKLSDEQAESVGDILTSYKGFMHTTHSHVPGIKSCFRVALDISRPLTPEEYDSVWFYLSEKTGNLSDEAARDCSRMYYTPACRQVKDYFFQTFGKEPIDVDSILSVAPAKVKSFTQADKSLHTTPSSVEESVQGPIDLTPYRERLKKHGSANVRAIGRGEPLDYKEGEGARINLLRSMSGHVGNTIFDCPLSGILEIVRPSIASLGEASGPESFIDYFTRLIKPIIADTKSRIEERKALAELAQAAARMNKAKNEPDFQKRLESGEDLTAPYTEEQIAQWAANQQCTPEEFQKRWIVKTKEGSCLMFDGALGSYSEPIPVDSFDNFAESLLARAPVRLKDRNEKGVETRRSHKDIVSEYGTVVTTWKGSFIEQHTRVDESDGKHELVQAVCPMIVREAEYDSEIQSLIEFWDGGSGELIEWFAAIPDLRYNTALLYLQGPGSAGKTLIGKGIAGLWRKDCEPSKLDTLILNNFNSDIKSCPICVADEGPTLDEHYFKRLRSLVTTKTHTLERKFLPSLSIEGSLRYYISANNDSALNTTEELNRDDIGAIQRRMHYRRLPPDAKAFMDRIVANHPEDPDYLENKWLKGKAVAKHINWLHKNVPFRKLPICGIGGDSFFAEQLSTSVGSAIVVCTGVLRIFGETVHNPKTNYKWFKAGEGELFVNEAGFLRELRERDRLLKARDATLVRHIKNLSLQEEPAQLGAMKYNRLDVGLFERWSRRTNVGDADILLENVNKPNPEIAAWKASKGIK